MIKKTCLTILFSFLLTSCSQSNFILNQEDVLQEKKKADGWVSLLETLKTMVTDPDTELIKAIKDSNITKVKSLIANKENIDERNNIGRTPLIEASSKKNNYEIVKLLIDNGADINLKDKDDRSAVTELLQIYDESLLDVFLKTKRIDFNNYMYVHNTPLAMVINIKNMALTDLFIDNGADINFKDINDNTILFNALIYTDIEEIIEHLLSFNPKIEINNDGGYKTLNISSKRKEMFDLIFSKISDINKIQDNGKTILTQAIGSSDKELYTRLIEKNIDLNKIDRFGNNALKLAVDLKNLDLLKLLISKNIDLNTKFEDDISSNRNILMLEVNKSLDKISLDVINILLESKKIDINAQDEYGHTALSISLNKGNIEIIKLLLDNKANPNIKNNLGESYLDIAKKRNNQEIINILKYTGAF
ncbi:MAG: ankyrin repeat domain-containing protein [Candidatus Sericytochromatia bacterium]